MISRGRPAQKANKRRARTGGVTRSARDYGRSGAYGILGLRGRAHKVNRVFRASRDLGGYRVRLILWASMGRKMTRASRGGRIARRTGASG